MPDQVIAWIVNTLSIFYKQPRFWATSLSYLVKSVSCLTFYLVNSSEFLTSYKMVAYIKYWEYYFRIILQLNFTIILLPIIILQLKHKL